MVNPTLNPIRKARHTAGLTQLQVAEHIGVSLQAVSAWEQGAAEPHPRHGRALVALLAPHLTLEVLYSGQAA